MRKSFSLFFLLVLACSVVRAQFAIKIVIDGLPAKHQSDNLFVTGDYNQWNPNDPNSEFVKDASGKFIFSTDNVPANTYEIKITRGSTATVECAADGKPIDNRKVTINSDTTFHITIAGWTDDFAKQTVGTPGPAPVAASSAYLKRKVQPSSAR
jgi:hypothetical protein